MDKLESDVQGAIDANPEACGLAIIVSNGYEGTALPNLLSTIKDAEAMRAAFTKLNFATYCEHDVRKIQMARLALEVANCNYHKSYKCIAFVFAGHGRDNHSVVCYDNKPMSVEELVDPFQPRNAPKIGNLPKLFFIDACETRGAVVPKDPELTVPKEGNFLVAYSSMEKYKAREEKGSGGLWMTTLARLLPTSDESIVDILGLVNRELISHCQSDTPLQWGHCLNGLVKLKDLAGLGADSTDATDDVPDTASPDSMPVHQTIPIALANKCPTPKELSLLRWNDGKETRIKKEVGIRWRELGIALGFKEHELETIEANALKDVSKCNFDLFGAWARKGDYTWGTLIRALQDAELEQLAKDVTAALNFLYPQ